MWFTHHRRILTFTISTFSVPTSVMYADCTRWRTIQNVGQNCTSVRMGVGEKKLSGSLRVGDRRNKRFLFWRCNPFMFYCREKVLVFVLYYQLGDPFLLDTRRKHWTPGAIYSGHSEKVLDAQSHLFWMSGAISGRPEKVLDARNHFFWTPGAMSGRPEKALDARTPGNHSEISTWGTPGSGRCASNLDFPAPRCPAAPRSSSPANSRFVLRVAADG